VSAARSAAAAAAGVIIIVEASNYGSASLALSAATTHGPARTNQL
jgi:hypothetical protein